MLLKVPTQLVGCPYSTLPTESLIAHKVRWLYLHARSISSQSILCRKKPQFVQSSSLSLQSTGRHYSGCTFTVSFANTLLLLRVPA